MGWVGVALLDPFDGPYWDMAWYHVSAVQLANGNGLTNADGTPTAQWPPVYPAFLALVYKLSGYSSLAGKLANGILGALTTFFVYLLARRLEGPGVALGAALLYATSFDNIFFSNFLMSEVLFGAVFTGAIWLFAVTNQRSPEAPRRAWFALGIALGVTSLTRGIAVAWLAVPVLIWFASTRSWRTTALRGSLAALGMLCVILPWTARNTVRMGYPVAIATSVGMVLANGHGPWETGVPGLKTLVFQNQFRRQYEHLPRHRREVAEMRGFTRWALGYMAYNPGHELRLIPVRLQQLFLHGHEGLGIGRPKEGGERTPFYSPGWHRVLVTLADTHFYLLLGLGLAGMLHFLRRPERTAWVVPLTLAYVCSFHSILFPATPRYHFATIPMLAISAAALLSRLASRLGSGQGASGGAAEPLAPEPER